MYAYIYINIVTWILINYAFLQGIFSFFTYQLHLRTKNDLTAWRNDIWDTDFSDNSQKGMSTCSEEFKVKLSSTKP